MQENQILPVVLILLNLYGYTGTPTSAQDYETSSKSDELLIGHDGNEDAATHATFVRSTSISAPYQHMYISSAKRRTEPAEDVNAASASESFYPHMLRNSRHYFQNSEVDRFRPVTTGRAKFTDQSLLGSGDFGVLKGGTFYQDSDQQPVRSYNDFYGGGNGHQRPFASPLVQKFRYPTDSSDPFSNFRDFADINVSNDAGQYSELYVVYANKNNTTPVSTENQKPNATKKTLVRNIKDQLDLIDDEISSEQKLLKLSKMKLKLRKSKKHEIIKNSSTTQMPSTTQVSDSDSDFMLALS